MTWQKLLAIQIGAVVCGCGVYLAVTGRWTMWLLFAAGFALGGTVDALQHSHQTTDGGGS